MAEKKEKVEANPLIKRLLTVFGAPDRTDDVQGFLQEYRALLDRYGPNVLNMAAGRLIRDGGKYWPTPKACVDACVDAQEEMAAAAASAASGKPKVKMPWEVHTEQAKDWATQYIATSELGQQAQSEGWKRELWLYAMSYAKHGYATGQQLPQMKTWRPSEEIVAYYRQPYLKSNDHEHPPTSPHPGQGPSPP